jgi:hypothetical protein
MLAALTLSLALVFTQGQARKDATTVSGQEEGFTIETRAEPRELRVEEPLILTVRIERVPRPDKLPAEAQPTRRLPALVGLKDSFDIEELPEKDSRPNENTWEFSYRLRPRSTRVTKIPRLEYKFRNPATGALESSFSSSIALRVLPRGMVSETRTGMDSEEKLDARYPFHTGSDALERCTPAELPDGRIIGLLIIAPPIVCAACWQIWRRRFPNASQMARRRRSRAARAAFVQLSGQQSLSREENATRVAAVLTQYLHERIGFPGEEPTPYEAVLHLEQAGVDHELAEQTGELFRACDAARFTAEFVTTQEDLTGEAGRLIRALEDQECFSRPA